MTLNEQRDIEGEWRDSSQLIPQKINAKQDFEKTNENSKDNILSPRVRRRLDHAKENANIYTPGK